MNSMLVQEVIVQHLEGLGKKGAYCGVCDWAVVAHYISLGWEDMVHMIICLDFT